MMPTLVAKSFCFLKFINIFDDVVKDTNNLISNNVVFNLKNYRDNHAKRK